MLIKVAGKPAITSSMALRKMCFHRMRSSLTPLARAVTTYCLRISSRKAFLVNMVRAAKPPITVASTGRVMCHR
ncbi:hypothetical protein D3C76_1823200 [compost metagenome]